MDSTTGEPLLHPVKTAVVRWDVVATADETEDGRKMAQFFEEDIVANEPLFAWWRGDVAEAPWTLDAHPWVSKGSASIVVGVKCAASAVVQRDAMRRTWLADAPADGRLQVRFLIGRATDPHVAAALEREQALYPRPRRNLLLL